MAPSGPSGHLPRERGRTRVAPSDGDESSPAKRGRGTMRSMVEGAQSRLAMSRLQWEFLCCPFPVFPGNISPVV